MSRVSQALDIRIPKLCMACSVLGIEYKLAGRQSVLRQCPSSLKNSICALTLLFVEGKPSAIKHLSLAWLSTCHRLEEENLGWFLTAFQLLEGENLVERMKLEHESLQKKLMLSHYYQTAFLHRQCCRAFLNAGINILCLQRAHAMSGDPLPSALCSFIWGAFEVNLYIDVCPVPEELSFFKILF